MGKPTIIVLSLLLLLIVSIDIVTFAKNKDNDCNKCTAKFITTRQLGRTLDIPIEFKVNATDLYNGLLRNQCIITWNKDNGFYKQG